MSTINKFDAAMNALSEGRTRFGFVVMGMDDAERAEINKVLEDDKENAKVNAPIPGTLAVCNLLAEHATDITTINPPLILQKLVDINGVTKEKAEELANEYAQEILDMDEHDRLTMFKNMFENLQILGIKYFEMHPADKRPRESGEDLEEIERKTAKAEMAHQASQSEDNEDSVTVHESTVPGNVAPEEVN